MIDPAVHGAVMFYAADIYGHFNGLTYQQCREASEAANNASIRYPLFSRDKKGRFPEFDIPHFGKRSSVYCGAIMSAWLVWCNRVLADNPLPSSALLSAANDGLTLWPRDGISDYWKGRMKR